MHELKNTCRVKISLLGYYFCFKDPVTICGAKRLTLYICINLPRGKMIQVHHSVNAVLLCPVVRGKVKQRVGHQKCDLLKNLQPRPNFWSKIILNSDHFMHVNFKMLNASIFLVSIVTFQNVCCFTPLSP